MSRSHRRLQMKYHRILTWEELGVEYDEIRDVPEYDGLLTPMYGYIDKVSGKQIELFELLRQANTHLVKSDEIVVYDDLNERFVVVTTSTLKEFKCKNSSTDYVYDGLITKGDYTIPAAKWHAIQ